MGAGAGCFVAVHYVWGEGWAVIPVSWASGAKFGRITRRAGRWPIVGCFLIVGA